MFWLTTNNQWGIQMKWKGKSYSLTSEELEKLVEEEKILEPLCQEMDEITAKATEEALAELETWLNS